MSARGRPVAGAGDGYRLNHQKMSNSKIPKISSRDMAPTSSSGRSNQRPEPFPSHGLPPWRRAGHPQPTAASLPSLLATVFGGF